ncbi:MAG: hypothetical protein F6K11_07570 [Leptolyngbya sp. SIO3F4]|nr:hypothetical protein [Leptolyngbya sp. SIO3F4]
MIQQLYTQPIFHQSKRRTKKQLRRKHIWNNRSFLIAGWGLATLSLLFNVGSYFQASAADTQNQCEATVQSSAVLSRSQLAELLTIPERANQQSVKDIVSEPYCQMPAIEVRDGVTAKREAYPLAFAPRTWLVMLYEEEEYAGFSFSFQN